MGGTAGDGNHGKGGRLLKNLHVVVLVREVAGLEGGDDHLEKSKW